MRLQKNELEEHFLRSIISLLSHQAIKPEFQCPISLDIMSEPVALVATGVVYDKRSIKEYLSYGYNKCPVTQLELKTKDFIEIPLLKSLISSWKQEFKVGLDHHCNFTGILIFNIGYILVCFFLQKSVRSHCSAVLIVK